ncbi:MAG: hypothetical protein IJR01_05630 [Bacteroidales bacterium]|nr:hypothetical protein [Bacteroidales bacterium]
MKFLAVILFCLSLGVNQSKDYSATTIDGCMLDGRLLKESSSFQRVPESYLPEMTPQEQRQAKRPAGQFYTFKTQSNKLGVIVERDGVKMGSCNGPISQAGFDLYIKKDGAWLWAGSVLPVDNTPSWIVTDMAEGEKECLLYMPLSCEVKSLRICHSSGTTITHCSSFRHKIAVFGSSFTEGAATSRPGMTWPAQLSRKTGIMFAAFGFSGNAKLQPYFADMLAKMDVDAYVVDGFSNPSPEQIKERLFPFIEVIRNKKPDTPIIFLKSIYRESRNFNKKKDVYEQRREVVSDSLMKVAIKTYDGVYWVKTTNATDHSTHETSVDGTHPSDYGYTLWAESVRQPILKILKKRGIK